MYLHKHFVYLLLVLRDTRHMSLRSITFQLLKNFFSQSHLGIVKTGYGLLFLLAFTKQALFSAVHMIVAMHTDRALTILFWHLSISRSVQDSLVVFLSLVLGPNAKRPLCDSELIFCTPIWKVNAWVCQVSPGDLSKRLFVVNPIPWLALNYLWFEGSFVNYQTAPSINWNQILLKCGCTIIPILLP